MTHTRTTVPDATTHPNATTHLAVRAARTANQPAGAATQAAQEAPRGGEARYEALAARFRPVFERIAVGAAAREQDHVLPFEQIGWLKDAGFTTLRVPAAHGGDPVGHEHLFRLLVELAEADSNVSHLLRSHFAFVETIALQSSAFQETWFPRVLAGEIFGNAATERGGNALGTTATTLRHDGNGWVLTGEKYYTTGSIFADWIVVMASTEGVEGRQYAVVRADDPSVTIHDDWDGFGQPLTGTGTAVFDGVHVAEANIIQRKVASTLEPAFFQLVLLAVLAGIGRAALRDAAALVATRTRTFNTGSGSLFRDDPLIQEHVGGIAAKVYAAEAIVAAAARDLDAAVDPELGLDPEAAFLRAELGVQKAHVSVPQLVLDAAGALFDVTGASATSRSKALDRHWRNARTVATHNPAVFKARSVGDFHINGTIPTGLNSIGEAVPSAEGGTRA